MSPKDQNENKLINPIDLDKIKEKVEANEYKTPEEFFVDIKWAQHNVFIIHPSNVTPVFNRFFRKMKNYAHFVFFFMNFFNLMRFQFC